MRHTPLLMLLTALAGCAGTTPSTPNMATPAATAPVAIDTILQKQIYQMTPVEAGRYVAWVHEAEPDLRKRIAAIGRKNLGQPYLLNLLGEFPFEVHDNLPLFSLERSDCVVFAEHTYAMGLSRSWKEFFWMLQRLRYRDGVIGVATRNHYTEMDWNVANRWLVTDISAELAGPNGPGYDMRVDRARFLKMRHNTERSIPVETSRQAFVPKEAVAAIAGQLQEGDFVNSQAPQVREESFDSFIARALEREARNAREGKNGQRLAGFKFLRLNENIVVPPMAPQPRPGTGS
jgi:hypothetical protein